MCLDCDVLHPCCHAVGPASEGSPVGQTPKWILPCSRAHTGTGNRCPEKSKDRVSTYDGSASNLHGILQAWYGVSSWETSKELLSKYLCGLLLDLGKPFASMCPLAGCSADVKEGFWYFEFGCSYLHLMVQESLIDGSGGGKPYFTTIAVVGVIPSPKERTQKAFIPEGNLFKWRFQKAPWSTH